jgi:WD40-like Beta Propeller Repeat
MRRQWRCAIVVVTVITAAGGCGSGRAPSSGLPGGGDTTTVGPLRVVVKSAAGFRTATLPVPTGSAVSLIAMYGSTIVRLEEFAYCKLAFYSNRSGNDEIWSIISNGANPVQLTSRASQDLAPAWSPDGTRIAFQSNRAGPLDIWVMNADGSGLVNLNTDAHTDECPSWSPDGTKIAYDSIHGANPAQIYVMKADGTGKTQLTTAGGVDPAWSPDGKKIAFGSGRTGDDEIYTMNADGSAETQLTTTDGTDLEPAWSPDGKKIAFRTSRNGNSDIYTMNVDGSSQVNLTHSAWDEVAPSWSRNGREIAFSGNREGNNEICVMSSTGADARNVTNNEAANEGTPAWCPVPTVKRTLVGVAGSDAGSDPPFDEERPLAIVGLTPSGMVAATTIGTSPGNWGSIALEPLTGLGSGLAGCKITVSRINSVQEDAGVGLPPIAWGLEGSPNPGAVLILFAADTGKVASVIAVTDSEAAVVPRLVGDHLVLRGRFGAAWDARTPGRDRVGRQAGTLVLDARTGAIVSVR